MSSELNKSNSNRINSVNDDEDERFYDAVENDLNLNDKKSSTSIHLNKQALKENLNGFKFKKSNTEDEEFYNLKKNNDQKSDEDDDDDDDDDDSKCFFFDTATSRHASERSEHNRTRSVAIDEKQNSNIKIKIEEDQIETEKNLNENDDDEKDAELETAWSFWIDRNMRGTTKNEYCAGLKLIHTVKTVQTFWSVFNNIPDVSALPNRCSYHLMRNQRRPLWEDEENSRGGQWKLRCKKEDTSIVWREALLAGIGEQLSDCVSPKDDIVGLSVGRREKDDIIQIWNLDHRFEAEATILEKLQSLVPDVNFTVKFYKAHNSHDAFEGPTVKNSNHLTSNQNNKNSNLIGLNPSSTGKTYQNISNNQIQQGYSNYHSNFAYDSNPNSNFNKNNQYQHQNHNYSNLHNHYKINQVNNINSKNNKTE